MAKIDLAKPIKNKRTKIKQSKGDITLEVICYIIFTICAILCIYPFYYIIINTISANDLSAKERLSFGQKVYTLKTIRVP